VPIRLALRAIKDGDNPLGTMPLPVGGAAGLPPGMRPAGSDWQSSPAGQASEAYMEAVQKMDAGDGAGCLTLLQRVAGLDARQAESTGFHEILARCTMKTGKCEDGKKAFREVIASRDTNRTRSDKDLDRETRAVANHNCPSSTATNASDFISRASEEMDALAKANDAAACQAKFEAIAAKIPDGAREWKESLNDKDRTLGRPGDSVGKSALERGAICIAQGKSCDAGLVYYKRWYHFMLPGFPGVDKTAEEAWGTMIKQGRVTCAGASAQASEHK
jgi:hypothetical protein